MRLAQYAKENLTDLPYGVGALLAKVPYSLRPGIAKLYRSRRRELRELEAASTTARREFVFRRVKQVAEFAYENVPFYRDKYRAAGVYPSSFTSFADIASLPIVDKSELQAVPLEDRSSTRRGRSLVNTGGSSGEPLEFFIEPTSIPHEWAHMHEIWSRVGYRQSDLRLVFGGRSGITDGLRYDGARHQWNIDIQRGWEDIAERLCPILAGHKSIYLHGYPSSIFDFVVWAKDKAHPILPLLETRVRAMLLGSEAPAPSVRQTVERILGAESISWYGHTERAVLAGEALEPGQYHPYLSYGFAESVEQEDGAALVATSYHNLASPLIRYNTGDLVSAEREAGLLDRFAVARGRSGEYIMDSRGNKVFLTGLMFGRHHRLFGLARHIQVRPISPGAAEIIVVPRQRLSPEEAAAAFDDTNVHVTFSFRISDAPQRTSTGKLPLLVPCSR